MTTAIVSFVAAICVDHDFKDFLNGVITVQAILIGFSFSVMFFLMSSVASPVEIDVAESIEAGIRRRRLAKLSKEIFYNVGYFNMTAMACLTFALLILLPDQSDNIWHLVTSVGGEVKIVVPKFYGILLTFVEPLVRLGFFFLLLESGFTFARTVGRVNYLFEQKLPPESGA